MKNFAYDIQLGFLAFPLVAIVLAMPYALYQYRRFGAISIWKTFVVFTFILYCLCAVSLIVFPLPSDPSKIVEIAQTPQLQPFHFVEQIQETTDFSWSDRSTWGPTLKARATYEAYFNVLLTVPLGAYLCYLFRCRWWMALSIGMATTLLFETSQLTGLFGIYEHPYRLFDVDDLILNTTGTMIGFWLMIPLAWALPSMDEVNEHARERGSSRVSLTRRLLAGVVDLTILVVCFVLAWILLSPTDAQIAKVLAIDPSRAGAKTLAFRFVGGLLADPLSALLIALGIGALLFAVIPMFSRGRTIGKALVGIRIVKSDGQDAPLWSYWVRFFASAFFLMIPAALVLLAPEEIEGVSSNMLFQIVGLVVAVWAFTIIARVVGSFRGYPYVSLCEVMSGTRLIPSSQVNGENTPHIRDGRTDVAEESFEKQKQDVYPENVVTPKREDAQQAPAARRTASQAASQASEDDDFGKQAALDSLSAVNYDEQHPLIGEQKTRVFDMPPTSSSSEAPTRQVDASQIPQDAAATKTRQIGAPRANPTQRITNPNVQRKIRRDQRPDAGGTQVFKKR